MEPRLDLHRGESKTSDSGVASARRVLSRYQGICRVLPERAARPVGSPKVRTFVGGGNPNRRTLQQSVEPDAIMNVEMATPTDLPSFVELMWPTLQVVQDDPHEGGSPPASYPGLGGAGETPIGASSSLSRRLTTGTGDASPGVSATCATMAPQLA
jgi:hypothetical protein